MSQPFPTQSYNPFALGHIIGSSQNLGAITNTTGVSPIVIALPSHGLAAGNRIRISGVTGQATINGTWTIGVIDPNTISIPIAGTGTASAAGVAIQVCVPLTINRPTLGGQGYTVNSITFQAFASNTGNIYVGFAATMINVSPFTDVVYAIKPGTVQNMPFFSPGASNIISIDGWGIDWDAGKETADGVLVSVFSK